MAADRPGHAGIVRRETELKPLFTIHEGEFLVGDHIIRKFGNKYEVWIPAKDNGVDLLVTPTSGPGKPVTLQVKFSRGFNPKSIPAEKLLGWGWYTLNPAKIKSSKADVWVFVILTLQHNPYFILIPTAALKKRIPRNSARIWHLYLAAFSNRKCYDMRGVARSNIKEILDSGPADPRRDFTAFLENWDVLDAARE
jgi:hypothetical protein